MPNLLDGFLSKILSNEKILRKSWFVILPTYVVREIVGVKNITGRYAALILSDFFKL